jgi:hypothetical protein
VVLDGAVIVRHGFAAFPSASFSQGAVFGAAAGVSLMFAVISFIGFESAALYGEEASSGGPGGTGGGPSSRLRWVSWTCGPWSPDGAERAAELIRQTAR